MSRPDRLRGWVIAGALLILLSWALVHIGSWTAGPDWHTRYLAMTGLYMGAGAVLLAALWWLRRTDATPRLLLWIVFAGLIMRAVGFTEPPQYEDDHYRFMWDGAVTAHGYNPYTASPVDLLIGGDDRLATDPAFRKLVAAGRPTIQKINNEKLTTIYPPVAQGFFALAYWIRPFDSVALRAVFLAAEGAMLLLLIALMRHLKLPLHWVAIYWWNPIAIKEFYVAAHMDSLALLFAVAAVFAAVRHRRRIGIVLLALAVGAKLWPVVLAPILVRYGAKSKRQVLTGMALLALVAGLILWPLAASWSRSDEPSDESGISAYAHRWVNNAGLFSAIYWSTQQLDRAGLALEQDPLLIARWITVGLGMTGMLILLTRRLPDAAALTRWTLVAVGGLFLISPTQFPWYYTWMLPFLALTPARPLLLYTALIPLYHLRAPYPWVIWIEHLPVWLLVGWSVWRTRQLPPPPAETASDTPPPSDLRVSVVIPALNEEKAIGQVLAALPSWVHQVIVADNGSTDRTAAIATEAGATVVSEPKRGYGSACLAGIGALDRPDIVVFVDADFSDHPEEINRLVEPIVRDEADLVIGSRPLGRPAPGALTPQQRFGNALACGLIRLLYRARYTDLGPFRAIRASALSRLTMEDTGYGWTVQMQVRAARRGLRSVEIPVSYRRRIGTSKISGTVRGVVGAGTKIISTIFRESLVPTQSGATPSAKRLIIMTRHPEPGRVKTRLIPLLGPAGAARMHHQFVRSTLATARRLAARSGVATELFSTGASTAAMASLFGGGVAYRDQDPGDLGERLHGAASRAFASGAEQVILIGTDCPLLTADRLEEAYTALDDHDIVLGPATDGGYYLIGMKASDPALFTGPAWGGPDVLEQTLAIVQRLCLSHHLLPPLPDVDHPEDLATWSAARCAPEGSVPQISVIVPTHNEQDHLAATLGAVFAAENIEIIVADGQSDDRTVEIARAMGATVVSSVRSRGLQLNAGATQARGDILLFLHADTLLPPDYAATIRQTVRHPQVAAGAFRFAIDAPGLGHRLIEWSVCIRSSLFERPYGDQALFITRERFRECGGFPPLPYMEDYAMLPRLKKLGRIVTARSKILTSPRSWQTQGCLRTTLQHQWTILCYHLGRCPTEPKPPKASRPKPPPRKQNGQASSS